MSELQEYFDGFERAGFRVTEVERVEDGAVIRFDDAPEEPEPVVDPLEGVRYAEIDDYARSKGVADPDRFGYFPTEFWLFGVSPEMDYQVRRNLREFWKIKLLGAKFAYAWRYKQDGTAVEEPDVQVYLGYTPEEKKDGAAPDTARLIRDAKQAIDRAAKVWIRDPLPNVPTFDDIPQG